MRELNDGIVMLHFGLRGAAQAVVLIDLIGGHAMPDLAAVSGAEWCNCKSLLSSNEARYGGTDAAPFCEPTTLVLELAP